MAEIEHALNYFESLVNDGTMPKSERMLLAAARAELKALREELAATKPDVDEWTPCDAFGGIRGIGRAEESKRNDR